MNTLVMFAKMRLTPLCVVLCPLSLALALLACGGGRMDTSNTSSQLSKSYWNGGGSCTISGIEQSYSGPPPCSPVITQCPLHAGATEMNFTAIPSGPWFEISPIFGTIPTGGNTSIALTWIDVTQLPVGNNTGVFIVQAPGYEENDGLSFSVNSSGNDGKGNPIFTFSFACPTH
jgi:hypothetical protein